MTTPHKGLFIDMIAQHEGLAAELRDAPEPEPMFWVRLCSDGCYEGPIHNICIERVRKLAGVWSPLFLHPPTVREPLTDAELRAEFAKWRPDDEALLTLSENNPEYALDALGARHHWTAFKAGARAMEAIK